MADCIDSRFMRLAIALGARGLGQVAPNPAVGCVLVREGRIIARSWTGAGGRPHAETVALREAGAAARGATAYVSLEPCAHHGHTPPCADALIDAGVARVVTALTDPDPRVAGRGHDRLRAAGIAVHEGVEAAAAATANAGFLMRVTRGRPWLTLKLALSLDGRIATASGESRWITGAESRRVTHSLRARHDAVMVGAGTARADDPDLRVRGIGVVHQPVRIVVCGALNLSSVSILGRSARAAPVWIAHTDAVPNAARVSWDACGARLIGCPADHSGAVDPAALMQALGREGLTRVFCEGGGQLAAALLRADLVDELVTFHAGKLIGSEGRAGLGPLSLQSLAQAPGFTLQDSRRCGEDILSRWLRGDTASA